MALATKTIHLLRNTDSKTLAKWYCQLNKWEWPSELGKPESRNVNGNPRRTDLMNAIQFIVGEKTISQAWNFPEMNCEQFEKWWKKHGRTQRESWQ
jgi:hypothetical protein